VHTVGELLVYEPSALTRAKACRTRFSFRYGRCVRGWAAARPVRARGGVHTDTPLPAQLPQAVGLVRTAIETELVRSGEARVAIRRLRGSGTMLVGANPTTRPLCSLRPSCSTTR
jgi:hypothetical protein